MGAFASRTPQRTYDLSAHGTAQPLATVPFSVRPPLNAEDPATLQAQTGLSDIPPGRYTANAVIRSGEKTIAVVSRVVEVLASPHASSSPANAPLPAGEPPAEHPASANALVLDFLTENNL